MSDKPEIKPCPFCGKDASYYPNNSYGDEFTGCGDCEFAFSALAEAGESIKRWNTRPREQALMAEIAGLKAKLRGVANVAHHGALIGYSDAYDAMSKIRELTVAHWDSDKSVELINNHLRDG